MQEPNEGARLLRLAIATQRLTQQETEKRIRARSHRRGSISRYLSGARLPDRIVSIAMRDEFGIPVDAWDQKPAAKGARRTSDKKAPTRQDVQRSRTSAIQVAS